MSAHRLDTRLVKIASLLFGSGMCALIYQIVWLRELRLVFGASTAASAAVLAIFMGGLGVGGALLGKRADRAPSPLRLYAHLELMIAAAAAATPFLLDLSRFIYVNIGGASVLGMPLATVVRLLLSAVILGVPTVLMGGTLPAAAKAVETSGDEGRSKLAVLYGVNTVGAVLGVCVATFQLLELVGTRRTLLLAALANLIVGLTARSLARRLGAGSDPEPAPTDETEIAARVPPPADRPRWLPPFVYASAFGVGFAFLLMELVWYRLLTPLLGGTTYTFALILAVALFGIGLGGIVYALVGARLRPTLQGFALSCALEAVCLALPFALGDRLAYLAQSLRGLGSFGFSGHLVSWTLVAALTILPAAIVAGLQFPLLVALLGRGGESVGRQLGIAYAWNTAGAILGSLAGGFGLLPGLTAPGTWRLVVVLLAMLGLTAAVLELAAARRFGLRALSGVTAALALLLISSPGPTVVWRQSPVGAGRVRLASSNPNGLRHWSHEQHRHVLWQREGIESGIGLLRADSVSFLINGKSDGNAKLDAPTQVWLGLLGAFLHPHPERGLVIGLGTGSSAGWLASVPGMQVDVLELEPAVVEVARICAPVNRNVLDNPNVRLILGDAREILLTTPERYDLIGSGPSNPFRAGISSLYTQDFYRAAASRLREGGIFLQWLQGYEVDNETVETVVATLASVFPEVEIWQTAFADLLLVASQEPILRDVPTLRQRAATEPFRSALLDIWRSDGLEGLLARFIANSAMSRAIAAQKTVEINTDDRNLVEFGFARTLGQQGLFEIFDVRRIARTRGAHRPEATGGPIDWSRVDEEQLTLMVLSLVPPPVPDWLDPEQRTRAEARLLYLEGRLDAALRTWQSQNGEPVSPNDIVMVAHALAAAGDSEALAYLDTLRSWQPAEADALQAVLLNARGLHAEAASALEAAFSGFRANPWAWEPVIVASLEASTAIAGTDSRLAQLLLGALEEPFALYVLENERMKTLLTVASNLEPTTTAAIFEGMEPWIPWDHWHLSNRFFTYSAANHPLTRRAEEDLADFLRWERVPFGQGLLGPQPGHP